MLKEKVSIPVCWNKPITRWSKLNTDGASLDNPGKEGGGGLVGDSFGNWIKEFSSFGSFMTV